MKTPTFKNVPLAEIAIGKTNPRKSFDEDSIKELSVSVAEKGILQPIILRTVSTYAGYELVSGERRFRAAKIAGLKEIPATIHDQLSDNDVLEIQITENLQRADVHPMEEAVAFKSLLDSKKYTIEEIAKRLGKNYYYVGQRLKLNELIAPLQKAFFGNRGSLSFFLTLCKFTPEIQAELWSKKLSGQAGQLHLDDWTFNQYFGDLNKAAFDQSDVKLNKAGACGVCVHNTASAGSLFPDEGKRARCLNITCFKAKASAHYSAELDKVKDDPTVELVTLSYSLEHGGTAQKLQKGGRKVYSSYDFDEHKKPSAPVLADYREDLAAKRYKNESEMTAAYNAELVEFEKRLKSFNKKVESGQYLKALVVEGSAAGHYVYITLKKKANEGLNTKGKAKVGKDGEAAFTAAEINSEITRIKDREKRAKELDEEKTTPLIFELLKKKTPGFTPSKGGELRPAELRALVILLHNYGGYQVERNFATATGFKGTSGPALYNFLVGKKLAALLSYVNVLTRLLILAKFEPTQFSRPSKNDEAASLVEVAKEYNKKGVEEILAAQNEIAAARGERVEAKLAGLKKQLREKPVQDKKPVKKAAK